MNDSPALRIEHVYAGGGLVAIHGQQLVEGDESRALADYRLQSLEPQVVGPEGEGPRPRIIDGVSEVDGRAFLEPQRRLGDGRLEELDQPVPPPLIWGKTFPFWSTSNSQVSLTVRSLGARNRASIR